MVTRGEAWLGPGRTSSTKCVDLCKAIVLRCVCRRMRLASEVAQWADRTDPDIMTRRTIDGRLVARKWSWAPTAGLCTRSQPYAAPIGAATLVVGVPFLFQAESPIAGEPLEKPPHTKSKGTHDAWLHKLLPC